MVDASSQHPAPSYADIEALPEHLVGEIVDGELVVSPRPATPHANVSFELGMLVGFPFKHGRGGPGGWWFLPEPELHLGRDVLVPDLAGWRIETMPQMPEVAALELAPDWLCEILSPSTERHDRIKKLASYARHRVQHVWLLHPLAKTLEVFRLDGETYRLVAALDGETKSARIEPFDAVELSFEQLWTPPATPA